MFVHGTVLRYKDMPTYLVALWQCCGAVHTFLLRSCCARGRFGRGRSKSFVSRCFDARGQFCIGLLLLLFVSVVPPSAGTLLPGPCLLKYNFWPIGLDRLHTCSSPVVPLTRDWSAGGILPTLNGRAGGYVPSSSAADDYLNALKADSQRKQVETQAKLRGKPLPAREEPLLSASEPVTAVAAGEPSEVNKS